MIKKVCIKLVQGTLCGGLAIVERNGVDDCIDFDVVMGGKHINGDKQFLVIVGGRGKKLKNLAEADLIEQALYDLFVKHNVLLQLGTHMISA